MKLTSSIVAIAALSGISFAGGMILEPAYENEVVDVPVEIPVAPEEEVIIDTPPPSEVYDIVPQDTQTETEIEIPAQTQTQTQTQQTFTPPPPPPPPPPPRQPEIKKEIVQQEAKEVVPPVMAKPSGLYIAGGVTEAAIQPTGTLNLLQDEFGQDRQVALTGRLGYDFMDYLGAELRGTYGIAEDNYDKFKQIGAYLKPNYNITDDINLYGLLGASKTNVGTGSDTGFSYGAGLNYGISDKVSVFTDVVNYLEKSKTAAQWGLSLGAAYQF